MNAHIIVLFISFCQIGIASYSHSPELTETRNRKRSMATDVKKADKKKKQVLTYKQAYNNFEKGDKPLLVLVTADWCPPCNTLKKQTLPVLLSKDAFKEFNFAMVDLGEEEDLARKLIGKRGVPQLILYEKDENGKYQRRYLRGSQSPKKVEEFLANGDPSKMSR